MSESTAAASRSQTILGHRAFTAGALLVLLALAAFLRLSDLETNPPGFWQDEASTGLDAYLIWTTGKDQAGDHLPIISRSFGDYPLAGYRYLVAPILGLLGPTPGHQRLVAATAGTLMVLFTFWVVARRFGRGPALAATLSAALTPTWIMFSRYGSEAILLPFSLLLGWALVDEGRQPGRRWAIWLGALSLAGSAYTYHAVKLILPLWMMGFLVFQWPLIKALWKEAKVHLFGPALLFAALVIPSMQAALTAGGQARGRTVLAWYFYEGLPLVRAVLSNYLSYFDPGMLFVRGGPAVAQSIPGLGMWNLIELATMIAGLATLFRAPARRRVGGFVLFWFLLGPLPGGITYETHNMGRVIAWLPAPQIISGFGLFVLLRWGYRRLAEAATPWRARVAGGAVLVGLAVGWAGTVYAVAWSTLVNYPRVTERDWQFEITRAMYCARDARTDEKIVISPRFQVASVFARFHFAELDEAAGERVWQLGDRAVVRPNEIYLFPARDKLPVGKELCRVVHGPTGQVYAYVFAAEPEPPLAPNPATPKLDVGRLPALAPGGEPRPPVKLTPPERAAPK